MFRILIAGVLIASVEANRVHVETHAALKSGFGASCEHLQNVFHNRIVAIQAVLDAHPDNDFSRTNTVSLTMRSYGIVRTLRRAKECSWVVDGDSDEIQATRAIVRRVLAENPCAEAARTELASGQNAESAEIEVQSLYRAMSVLSSENCEVEVTDREASDDDVAEAEAIVQDSIDELVEESESESSAFVQTNAGTFRRFLRVLGVVFLMIILTLACASAIAIVTLFVTTIVFTWARRAGLFCRACGRAEFLTPSMANGIVAGLGAGVIGLGGCSYQLYNQLVVPALN